MNPRKLLGVALLATISTAVPASADPVYDLLASAEHSAYVTLMDAERQLDSLVTVDVRPPVTDTRTLDYYTDAVVITDTGSGPVIETRGVLGQRSLWSCERTYGGGSSVVVTCTANPFSGVRWQCGVMHVNASALSAPADGYVWASRSARELLNPSSDRAAPRVPDPRNLRWGVVTGRVSCNDLTLMTEQANQDMQFQSATATMGAVTTLVCEARLSPGSATAPVTPYEVNCVDPANPTG